MLWEMKHGTVPNSDELNRNKTYVVWVQIFPTFFMMAFEIYITLVWIARIFQANGELSIAASVSTLPTLYQRNGAYTTYKERYVLMKIMVFHYSRVGAGQVQKVNIIPWMFVNGRLLGQVQCMNCTHSGRWLYFEGGFPIRRITINVKICVYAC